LAPHRAGIGMAVLEPRRECRGQGVFRPNPGFGATRVVGGIGG
ncbi:MAG: hypothetical protein RIS75_1373, partial [Actinomycetota bacterium]